MFSKTSSWITNVFRFPICYRARKCKFLFALREFRISFATPRPFITPRGYLDSDIQGDTSSSPLKLAHVHYRDTHVACFCRQHEQCKGQQLFQYTCLWREDYALPLKNLAPDKVEHIRCHQDGVNLPGNLSLPEPYFFNAGRRKGARRPVPPNPRYNIQERIAFSVDKYEASIFGAVFPAYPNIWSAGNSSHLLRPVDLVEYAPRDCVRVFTFYWRCFRQ